MTIIHVQSTIASLEQKWFFGPYTGEKYGRILDEKFNAILKPADKQAIDDALTLGNYLIHSEANKQQRHMVRAVLLAEFLMKNQPVIIKDQLQNELMSLSPEQLKRKFAHLFPAFLDRDKRAFWAPHNFTAVASLGGFNKSRDWTGHPIPTYTLFVHSLKYPSIVLNDPIFTLSRWTAISMCILSNRNPVSYTRYGIILGVPENNILTTSPTDQWFDNYAGTSLSIKAPGQSLAQHIAEKNLRIGGMLTPAEVVQMQGTPLARQHSAGMAITPHNEVVVCGVPGQLLPHGKTGRLKLLGVFIQTMMNGAIPDRYFQHKREITMALQACAVRFGVPMLYLPTTRYI